MAKEPISIGDYTLTNEVPVGAYLTYTATDKYGQEYKAIGVLTKTLSKSYFLQQFRNMFEVLNKISHPCIQKIVYFTNILDIFYVIMESSSSSAFTLIQDGNCLPELEAGKIFVSLIDAISVLHENNIAHLDIRPENLLLINDEYKLTNFLMSQLFDADTLITRYGTPNYQAPEIFQETGTRNPKAADIWAAGLTLYALLTGRVFFTSEETDPHKKFEDIKQKIKKQSKFVQQIPDIFSPDLRDLLELMLQQNPQNRITINDILRHPWVDKIRIEIKRTIRIRNISVGDIGKKLAQISNLPIEINVELPLNKAKETILNFCDNMGCNVINLCSTEILVHYNDPRAIFSIKFAENSFASTHVTVTNMFSEDYTIWNKFVINFRDIKFGF